MNDLSTGDESEDLIRCRDGNSAGNRHSPRRRPRNDRLPERSRQAGRQANGLAAELLDADSLPSGEGMVAGHGHDAFLAIDCGPGGEVWRIQGQPIAEDVDLAGPQVAVWIHRRDLALDDLAFGMS